MFVSAPIKPEGNFNSSAMMAGEPGIPARFRWGKRVLVVLEILERRKEYGECTHGSGERYVRRHVWRIRMQDGVVACIYFQRSFGRSRSSARWWLHSFEV